MEDESPNLSQNIPVEKLEHLRFGNPEILTFSYVNINYIKNIFDSFQKTVMDTVDILTVAETEIDFSSYILQRPFTILRSHLSFTVFTKDIINHTV